MPYDEHEPMKPAGAGDMQIYRAIAGQHRGDSPTRMAELQAECERLRKALSFYADETRYRGSNLHLDAPDEWSAAAGQTAYRLDVMRDGGLIARNALALQGVIHE